MKKSLASITLLVYLAFSCGVVINYHYCMGHLNSVKIFGKKSDKCGTCGMHIGKKHKCCGDESVVIKVQDDQQISQTVHSLAVADAVATIPSEFIITPFYNNDVSRHNQNHSPPLITEQDTYLQNCVFRI